MKGRPRWGDQDAWVDETPAAPAEPISSRSGVRVVQRMGVDARIGRRVVDRYELCAVLGTGASGVVYEALDTSLDEPVAVKVLHEHLRASGGHVARFAREVRATASIAHPSVVRVLDAGEDADGTLFLVMELLRGELLFDRLGRPPALATAEILAVGRELLGALAAAHQLGIVHRDIKPENLFLTREEDGSTTLKILDFGIAKLVEPQAAATFRTAEGLILGTPAYMSPEVCRGLAVTEAADLWAVAAVLYEALAGAPPFDEPHVGRLLSKVVKGRASSLREKRPDLPARLVETLDRALDPDPSRRWPTADAMAEALSAVSG